MINVVVVYEGVYVPSEWFMRKWLLLLLCVWSAGMRRCARGVVGE